jgi:hypothetical protein
LNLDYKLIKFISKDIMGRMQMKGKGKGISSSALPFKRKAPKWVTLTPSAVTEIIVKLAKKGKNIYIRSFSFLNRCFVKRLTRNSSS